MKILRRQPLLMVILIGLALSSALLFYFFQQNFNLFADRQAESGSASLIGNAVVLPNQKQENSDLPVRLKIPGINIDAVLEHVGLTPLGAMDVPKNPADAAWFNLGPRPGEKGSAVISGHYGWKDGIPAVFDNLHKLREGDKIYVEDEKGAVTVFVVRESRKYDQNADASNVFGSSDGKAHLNLITCGGVWNKAQKSYSDRLVVFTDKE